MSRPLASNAAAPPLEPACMALMQQAAEWRLLALLLSGPRDGNWATQAEMLAREAGDALLRQAVETAQSESHENLYDSIFGPGGPAPPREVSYRPATLASNHLAELAAHYAAFNFTSSCDEPYDHVAVETDFVAYLRFKQAFAVACGEVEMAEAAQAAAEYVVAEHLSYIAEPLAERLASCGVNYLRLAAEALLVRAGRAPVASMLPILQDGAEAEFDFCADAETDGFDSLPLEV